MGFPGSISGKEPACQCRRHKSCRFDPWVRKIPCPGGGHGYPLQYSCLENPMNRGAWQATVHRTAKSWTRLKWLNTTKSKLKGAVHKCAAMSDSLQPHGLQPTRLLCPWNFPGKNTGVGCHLLLWGNLSHSGIETMSPVLAGKFFITVPLGKSHRGLHFGFIFPLGAY